MNYKHMPLPVLGNSTNSISKYIRLTALSVALISSGASIAQTQDTVTTFTYDNMGNVKTVNAPLGRTVSYSYDALNRMTQEEKYVGSGALVTAQSYDGRNHVLSVTDPRNLVTAYTVDGLGNTSQLNSPDTQTSTHTVDEDGNVLTTTDARGKTTRFQYDGLGRLLQEQYQSGVPSQFEYDGGSSGPAAEIGNLTRVTDESGSTTFTHDARRRVLTKTQVVSAAGATAQLLIQYSYGTSGSSIGKLESITYPSGTKVNYHYDDGGRISSISLNPSSIGGGTLSEVTLLTDVTYTPTGQISSWRWNSPVLSAYQRTYDLDGRLTSYPMDLLGTVRTVRYDAASRITAYTHSGGPSPAQYDQVFNYDTVDRLTSVTLAGVTTTYGYDANGNRTQQTGPNVIYSYDTTTNRLRSATFLTPRVYNYDAAGNRISDGLYTYTYSDRGRLAEVRGNAILDMYYNAFGQRVLKAGVSKRTYYAYDEDGHTIGEYDQAASSGIETIYLGDQPVAVVAAQQYFYVVVDHINTPLVLAQQDGTTVWDWRNRDPFGNNAPIASSAMPSYDHRFPGQVADTETATFYNYFRDYDPQTGTYIESDPIGLAGGTNTYAYVRANPLSFIDADGLQVAAGMTGGELGVLGGLGHSNSANGSPLGQAMDGDGSRSRDPKASRRRESNVCPPGTQSAGAASGGAPGGDDDEPEKKVRKPGQSGKEAAKDVPSWARGEQPYVNENGKQFAQRLLNEKYGSGNWKSGPGTEYNQLVKYADRGFISPPGK